MSPAEAGHYVLHGSDPMRPEIAIEGNGRLLWLRQRHIAIRSHQVQPVSMKTGALHHRLPRKFMERQMAAGA